MEVLNGKIKITQEDYKRVEKHFVEVCFRDEIKYKSKKYYQYQSEFFCGAMTAWNFSVYHWKVCLMTNREIIKEEDYKL